MPTHQARRTEVAASIERLGALGSEVIERSNTILDRFIDKCLAFVAHRLDVVVESVDRVDGGTGLGVKVATAMARLMGFEVREATEASVANSFGLFGSPMVPARAQRRPPARARASRVSSVSSRLHPSVWNGIHSPAMAAVYRRPVRISESPAGAVRGRSSSHAMN